MKSVNKNKSIKNPSVSAIVDFNTVMWKMSIFPVEFYHTTKNEKLSEARKNIFFGHTTFEN